MTPLALDMLISLKLTGAMPINSSEEGKAALEWLLANGVIAAVPERALTDRGEAFLAMILDVPLPVQRWIDPRGGFHEFRGHTVDLSDVLGVTHPYPPAPKHEHVDPRPALAEALLSSITPSPEQKAAAYAATVPKPPEGFTHHLGIAWTDTDNEGNQRAVYMPKGLKPGDDVEIWYRDGIADKRYPDKPIPGQVGKDGKQKMAMGGMRRAGGPAGSINWQHRGGDDDVIGYRKLEQEAVTKMVMPKR